MDLEFIGISVFALGGLILSGIVMTIYNHKEDR